MKDGEIEREYQIKKRIVKELNRMMIQVEKGQKCIKMN